MTRKDYELIARTLAEANANTMDAHERWVVYQVTRDLATALAAENPRFDTDRFVKAAADQAPDRVPGV